MIPEHTFIEDQNYPAFCAIPKCGLRSDTSIHLRNGHSDLYERIRYTLDTCICAPDPLGDGPQINCPMHGRADFQAMALMLTVEPYIAAVQRGDVGEQTCSQCGGVYPAPVELHHSEDECLEQRDA